MTFQVRLYIHHDNDLIQLHLNGVQICDVFAKSLEAHYKKEEIQFMLPEKLEFKPHKGKVYRVKVTLDDKKQEDLIKWVCAFPDQYKCHCIKNIARTYLGTAVIDTLNGMTGSGAWMPGSGHQDDRVKVVPLKRRKKKTNAKDECVQWIDQVSASREKTEEQIRQIEDGRERIRNLPIEEILGTRYPGGTGAEGTERGRKDAARACRKTAIEPHAAVDDEPGGQEIVSPADDTESSGEAWYADALTGAESTSQSLICAADDAQGDGDEFDASLVFERMRLQ